MATLVSSRIEAYDSQGMDILQALQGVFHRNARGAEPVSRDDVAEILRRRLFDSLPDEPVCRAATDAFFSRLQTLPVRDEQKGQSA